jgi:hypothetical protein
MGGFSRLKYTWVALFFPLDCPNRGSKLLTSCGIVHPVDASDVIVKALLDKLIVTDNTTKNGDHK